ncbi:threonine ammonia-lyase [Phaeobacter inhibens]|uniref:threonine ammonia-lyase n=1 Tax=Phaeobacter inhibens TaxID=221822 RepID=UPI002490E0F7|nr:pyridoxal-phosphate dependent enzyme [Phaeobacter inhibens]
MTKNSCSPDLSVMIEAAERAKHRLAEWLKPSPTVRSKKSDNLWFKCEQFQSTGSFKIRGALNKIASPRETGDSVGEVITASSGNHGIACAQAGLWIGVDVTVVLPVKADAEKRRKLQNLGAKLLTYGDEAGQSEAWAREAASSKNVNYVSPYNDRSIIEGQATIGLELIEQVPLDRPLNIFVATGGGGLISGIAAVLKARVTDVNIWMVSAVNSCAMHESLNAKKIVDVAHLETFAEGVAGGIDSDTITFELCQALVDDLVLCEEDEIWEAYKDLAHNEGLLVEGAAALAYAGYRKNKAALDPESTIIVVLCGGNIDHRAMVQINRG